MRCLLLNQAFYPDVVSSGQHLTDLALGLSERGHQVTVVTSRRGYDNPERLFPAREVWRGISLYRVASTRFGKTSKWTRAADFASFILSCCCRLALLPRQDLVIAMTSPPLISLIGACFVWVRGGRLAYWVMDLNPDEAVTAGWLGPTSYAAKWLERFSRFSLRTASRVIALDRFMRDRLLTKAVGDEKISVIPPWAHDTDVRFDEAGRAKFRKIHGLTHRFVVMYSGNHSPCHPLDTVLEAAKRLAARSDIAFVFVGGGSEFPRIKQFGERHHLSNVLCLPYRPLSELAGSLSAADVHLVVMGDPFVGIVHPCKIYNILQVGARVLYIGPRQSHIVDILAKASNHLACGSAPHGDVDLVIREILRLKETPSRPSSDQPASLTQEFSSKSLLPAIIGVLEAASQRG